MTIDERLEALARRHEALAQSVELLTADIQAMQEEHKRLDSRERQARSAMIAGMRAYLQALDGGSNDQT